MVTAGLSDKSKDTFTKDLQKDNQEMLKYVNSIHDHNTKKAA
jgi:hypothetical protein